jgi:hypothetical protein
MFRRKTVNFVILAENLAENLAAKQSNFSRSPTISPHKLSNLFTLAENFADHREFFIYILCHFRTSPSQFTRCLLTLWQDTKLLNKQSPFEVGSNLATDFYSVDTFFLFFPSKWTTSSSSSSASNVLPGPFQLTV